MHKIHPKSNSHGLDTRSVWVEVNKFINKNESLPNKYT